MNEAEGIEASILSTFADVARSLGYSSVHGKIIGVLLIKRKPLSLEELAKETGYSTGMVSLSLDLLEVLGVVRKFKKSGDRRVHIELRGDLLECLKRAIIIKARKSVGNSLEQFEGYRKRLSSMDSGEAKSVLKAVDLLEKEMKRLERYIGLLEKV
jgi:DNA-binding transcriptional regulator GbsR (MarR family)